MASATVVARMVHGEGGGVHPFFMTRHSQNDGERHTDVPSDQHSALRVTNYETSEVESGPSKQKQSSKALRKAHTTSKLKQLPLFIGVAVPSVEIISDPIEDLQERPRKRQRTVSAEATPLVRQRSHERQDIPPNGLNLESRGQMDPQMSEGAEITISKPQAQIDPISPADELVTVPKTTGAQEDTVQTYTSNRKSPSPSGKNKGKTIKLRAYGKLASPKKPATKRKKGIGAQVNVAALKKVVVLTYGNDHASKFDIGVRVAAVLEGRIRVPRHKPAQVTIPSGPPKAMHPFFLGKVQPQPKEPENIDLEPSNTRLVPAKPKALRVGSVSPSKIPAIARKPVTVPMPGFGSSRNNSNGIRSSGALEPVWPPKEMMHICGPLSNTSLRSHSADPFSAKISTRKLKNSQQVVTKEEEVLHPFVKLAKDVRAENSRYGYFSMARQVSKPARKIVSGRQLQQLIHGRVIAFENFSYPNTMISDVPIKSSIRVSRPPEKVPHPVLMRLYQQISTSLTAFDKFECESQDWAHKYAPTRAADVLQSENRIILLREWLKGLSVNAVGGSACTEAKPSQTSILAKRLSDRAKRKRRKAEGLDDFIVSEDELGGDTPQISDTELNNDHITKPEGALDCRLLTADTPKSVNALVVSGPQGCGKSAAVYAVAQELGFEVFEINAGTRRSGIDIWNKVGDMTENHLVHNKGNVVKPQDLVNLEEENPLPQENNDVRQKSMSAFLTTKKKAKSKNQKVDDKPAKPKSKQKQSLILLEEVDILFEEDRGFWSTVMNLILRSRRPVIMTCTDESRVLLEDLAFCAILRLSNPPMELATDYLLLLAANEGHLLQREVVSNVYSECKSDLRASIMALNFECQMAIGDTKGGLEWMLVRSNKAEAKNTEGEDLRVVSENTYRGRIERLESAGHENSAQSCFNLYPHHLEFEVQNNEFQPEDDLYDIAMMYDALSAADLFPGGAYRDDLSACIEPEDRDLSDKERAGFIEGPYLLKAEPVEDPTHLSSALPDAIDDFRITVGSRFKMMRGSSLERLFVNFNGLDETVKSTKNAMEQAFKILAQPIPAPFTPKSSFITGFEGPISTITVDIAPYVRSIVSFDLTLEQQRLYLNNLLSQPGRSGKRQRTTRASRAALEGGSKASTRRERWFPKETNLQLVLRTGGSDWQAAVQEQVTPGVSSIQGGSRRSSISGSAVQGKFDGASDDPDRSRRSSISPSAIARQVDGPSDRSRGSSVTGAATEEKVQLQGIEEVEGGSIPVYDGSRRSSMTGSGMEI